MVKIDLMRSVDGEPWDDRGLGQQIATIMVTYDTNGITSLRFFYVKDNKTYQMSEQHGVISGDSMMISLDCPTEFLTTVRGSRDCNRIHSITFVTNGATYGPFGHGVVFGGEIFELRLGNARHYFDGFHGTVKDGYISSIGVNISTPTAPEPESSGRVKVECVSVD